MSESGNQRFKYDIEKWLSQSNHKQLFQDALDGDEEAFDWLPYWVVIGLRSMKRKMK